MQYQANLTIIGVEKVLRSGVSKTGNEYDLNWTNIHYLVGLDASEGNAIGQTAAAIQFGDASEYDNLKTKKFPFEASCVMTNVQQGNKTVQKLLSIKEVKP